MGAGVLVAGEGLAGAGATVAAALVGALGELAGARETGAFGLAGPSIASNWLTVTNLKPFAVSPSRICGTASTDWV